MRYATSTPASSPSTTSSPATGRRRVVPRDGYRCRYCGADATTSRLVLDHFLALADGGTDEPENLLTACWECNSGKGEMILPMPPLAALRLE